MNSKILLWVIALTATNCLYAQIWDWTKPEPNDNLPGGTDYAHQVATDINGNLYELGDYNNSLYLNNILREEGSGSYIAKYDSTGALLWYRLIKLNFSVSFGLFGATDLVVNKTGIFITGKLQGMGCYLGTYSIGNSEFTIATSCETYIGSYDEFFLCKMNFNGNVVWNKTSRNSGMYANYNPGLATDQQDNIILTANKSPVYNSNHVLQRSFSLGNDVITDNTSQNYLAQLILIKYTHSGNLLSSSYANDIGNNELSNVSCITDNLSNIWFYARVNNHCKFGNIEFVTLDSSYSVDVLAKLTSSGVWSSVSQISTYSQDLDGESFGIQGKSNMLTVDNSNNIYALVNLYNSDSSTRIGTNQVILNSFGPVCFLLKFSAGNLIWYKDFGGLNSDASSGITCYNNNLYITGRLSYPYTNNSFKFSKLTVIDESLYEGSIKGKYFIAKADLDGNFTWVNTFWGDLVPLSGNSIAVYNNNIYTTGAYTHSLTSLGNLNGALNSNSGTQNQFLGKLNDQYIKVVSVTPTQLIPGCTISIPFVSQGLTFSANNTFTAQLSDAAGSFKAAKNIGSINSTGSGSINATIPVNSSYGNGYRVRIRSSDTLKTGYNYYAYADTPYNIKLLCLAPSSGFSATNVAATSTKLNWASVGCASGYRIQYRVKGTTTWITVGTLTVNTPTYTLIGLLPNTQYQWRVATRCRNNGVVSFSSYSSAKQFTTTSPFAVSGDTEQIVKRQLKISVLPNPTSSNATLVIEGAVKNGTVTITDLQGKIIWMKSGIKSKQIELPIHNIAAGTYIVKLTEGRETRVVKLIRE